MAHNFLGRSLTANIAEQNVTLNIGFVYVITNDSANVVTLSFEQASSTNTELMVLKSGESRENLDFPIGKLYYKADVDTSAIRIEGLRKKSVNY